MAGSKPNSSPDICELKAVFQDLLANLLKSQPGRKDLVIDANLMKSVDVVAKPTFIRENGVEKIFKLQDGPAASSETDQMTFLLKCNLATMKLVVDQVYMDHGNGIKRKYNILAVPKMFQQCQMMLEKEGVLGDVTYEHFPLSLIPLDTDLMSAEIPEFFIDFFLDNNQKWICPITDSLMLLQDLYGPIPNVCGQGNCAKMVADMLAMLTSEQDITRSSVQPSIGQLILIDRDVDYVTPLLSQLVYQGILDDTFKIKCGTVEFGSDVTGSEKPAKLILSSQDPVYNEIRDKHFSNVFGYLSTKAREVQVGFEKRHDLATVSDMKNFVSNDLKRLKTEHRSLALHIGASEVILKRKNNMDFEDELNAEHGLLRGTELKEWGNFIEDCINRQLSISQNLRLLCLANQTNSIGVNEMKSIKYQLLQSHGFQHILTFHNLKKIGLLSDSQSAGGSDPSKFLEKTAGFLRKGNFRSMAKKIDSLPRNFEEIDVKNPNDMAYVFNGVYAPVSCRFVEKVLSKKGSTEVEEISRQLPGLYFNAVKAKSAKGKSMEGSSKSSSFLSHPSAQVVLVYFLGGCTYTEVSALRFLAKQKGYTILIATTAILNSSSIIDNLLEYTHQ